MRTLYVVLAFCTLAFTSCKKESSENPPLEESSYLNTAAGSKWVYHEINASSGTPVESDYTVTSTNKDTTVAGRKYHVYTFSFGGSRYLNQSGKDYYDFGTIAGAGDNSFERLYLTAGGAGTQWDQSETLNLDGLEIPIKIANTITGTNLSKEVQGTQYKNVIQVTTKITSELLPGSALTTDIQSFYAPRYGLIENTSKINITFMGQTEKIDLTTRLKSADLK